MTIEYNCANCSEKDTDFMVQCDTCDRWYHFDCVGVNSNVANMSWNCKSCGATRTGYVERSTPAPPTSNGEMSTATTGQPQAASSPTTGVQQKNAETSKDGLQSAPMDTITTLSNSITTMAPAMTSVGITSSAYSAIPATMFPGTRFPPSNQFAGNATTFTGIGQQAMQQYPPPSITTNVITSQNHVSVAQHVLQLELLEEERKIEQKYLQKKYEILSQGGSPPGINRSTTAPTSSQLAARQVIPKDLPNFSGNPDDWPLFISNYENSTAVAGYTDAENLMRLQKSLKGKAYETVRCKLLLPSMVPEIIQTLKMCFGRPEHILESLVEKARSIPPLKEKLESLIDFALCVQNICSTMEACQMEAHLNNPMLVKEFVDKLPNQHKLNWAMLQRDDRVPIIKAFSEWIFQIAEAASKVVTPRVSKKSGLVNTHSQSISSENHNKVGCVVCGRSDHKIQMCEEFSKLNLERKWGVVKANKLCRQCLNMHRRRCYVSKACGVDGCQSKHHKLLHKNISEASSASQSAGQNQSSVSSMVKNQLVNTHVGADEDMPCFRIIPVRLHSNGKSIKTFAFLDEGSSVTLMEKHIYDTLGLNGEHESLCLRWTGENTRMESDSMRTSIQISNAYDGVKYEIREVHTVSRLGLPNQSLNMGKITQKYPYLRGLPIESYENAEPTILIGANCWKLAVPIKIREGQWLEPIATKCRLGWALQGGTANHFDSHQLNFHLCDCEQRYASLHEEIKEYFNLESPQKRELMSPQDHKAMQILNSTCRQSNGRYEVGLLWKHDDTKLPSSYDNALKRFSCMQKKLAKDANLHRNMQQQINNLIEKGYARKLSADELESSRDLEWYLPIFITLNPNKPGKVRLVWDAAAKSNGAALNDFLLSGPDLLNSLVTVLMAFRTGKVAICGDIAEMFHQIRVREADMHAQRFLWHEDCKELHNPNVYVMRALTFGISCAPCIAHFVRDTNAEQYKQQFPRAVEAIQKYHYVDDLIDSVNTEEEALDLAVQVKTIHAKAGFHIRNWASNSSAVLSQLQGDLVEDQAPKDLANTEKILGLYWDPTNDVFKFICRFSKMRRDILQCSLIPTKREVLQVLMSIFDPLGFLARFTIGLKILLQEVWRSSINWDDPLPCQLYNKWCQWKTLLPEITSTTIPRCFSPRLKNFECIQLHTFVDAGEYAYAAICYLRVTFNNKVDTIIAAAKSKVTPLKPVSIPRLELQAAVIGVRLANSVVKALRVPIRARFWWSDSKTVLKWLRMDPRNFKQYVMHRVGEVLEETNTTDWHWVPSKLNPADLATKFSSQQNSDFWLYGPKFLSFDQTEWPKCEDLGSVEPTELRHFNLHVTKDEKVPLIDASRFSSWRRLYLTMAMVILFVEKLKSKRIKEKAPTGASDGMIHKAKSILIKEAQQNEYRQEIINLRSGRSIESDSKLISLNVYLTNDDVLKARGRAESLRTGDSVILPTHHPITFLIVRHYHERNHHQFHEAALNSIREQYYISRLRVLYRKVRRSCQRCKNEGAKPNTQQMATLPPARLASFERPFTYIGIDLFGPIYVSIGRRREKRWGVLFTCLTVRAVHLEVAHSLDVSSCIMCIQNFVARRGKPREIYTDNGTNFKAAAKALRTNSIGIETLNINCEDIVWRFNPPGAPHMGGAWERLVRSVKSVLNSVCPSFKFTDETLKSSLCEVEHIINSRPLTFVSLDSADDDALTPNHLLLGSTDGHKPVFNEALNLRQQWHKAQEFANKFWRRWLQEYTPIIQRRAKWFSKLASVAVGDVVVVVDETLPRNYWPKGIIVEVVKAKDDQVRRVTIKTKKGLLQRPATKVAVLDVTGTT